MRFLHGEAIAWGMIAAAHLASLVGLLSAKDCDRIVAAVHLYGPLPDASDLDPERLIRRLGNDKKTLQGKIHFVLPEEIGRVTVISGIEPRLIREAIDLAFAGRA